mmetsp:Transcript_16408/g.26208  ORF Transcript_16408/g.26208 Transcript_16408/m.26208 type:complete len:276 (-) Transcript_16408:320-1147(-)
MQRGIRIRQKSPKMPLTKMNSAAFDVHLCHCDKDLETSKSLSPCTQPKAHTWWGFFGALSSLSVSRLYLQVLTHAFPRRVFFGTSSSPYYFSEYIGKPRPIGYVSLENLQHGKITIWHIFAASQSLAPPPSKRGGLQCIYMMHNAVILILGTDESKDDCFERIREVVLDGVGDTIRLWEECEGAAGSSPLFHVEDIKFAKELQKHRLIEKQRRKEAKRREVPASAPMKVQDDNKRTSSSTPITTGNRPSATMIVSVVVVFLSTAVGLFLKMLMSS